MREIKFRAWGVIDKVMWTHEEMCYDRVSYKEVTTNLERFPLMQYTGLKDKNGKEIYEGDIMQSDNGYFIGVVEFNKGVFILSQGKDALGRDKFDVLNTVLDFEIIGNIYENSNLLGDNIEQN